MDRHSLSNFSSSGGGGRGRPGKLSKFSLYLLSGQKEETHFFQATSLKEVEEEEEIQFQMMHWKVEEEVEMEVGRGNSFSFALFSGLNLIGLKDISIAIFKFYGICLH